MDGGHAAGKVTRANKKGAGQVEVSLRKETIWNEL